MGMTHISRRECLVAGLKNEEIDFLVQELRAFLKEEKVAEGYSVNIYKDFVGCCGAAPLGVCIEIEGSDEKIIEDLDQRVYAKIIEICERKGIDYHKCYPVTIV